MKDKEQLDFAKNIYELYLNGSQSKLEVNVSKSVCNTIKKRIDEGYGC